MSHVDTAVISHISLCYGYGGIDLGLHRIFGGSLRLAAVCEIEAFAVENALSKMEAGLIPAAPIWNDLRTFPWEEFQGIDLVSGGFPCQPFSAAGKRAGDQDPRHLFPAIVDGIRRARPRLVFLENVEGIISAKLAGDGWNDPSGTPVLLHVLRELERVGYQATAGIFSASVDAGAPHQRKRVFVMAYRHGERGQLSDWWQLAAESLPVGDGEAWRDEFMADPMCERRQQVAGSALSDEEANGRTRWNIQQPDGHYVTASHVQGTAWPSRPGEPQHGWEPPRVVVDAKSQRNGQRSEFCGEECGSGGALPRDVEQSGQAMANAEHGREDGASAQMGGKKSSEDERESETAGTAQTTRDGCAGAMGYAANKRCRGLDDEPSTCGQREAGRHADRTSDDAGQVIRQTQPALGGDADGPASGLGLSEHTGLSDHELAEIRQWMERVDNRTDELRLLGNGVLAQCAAVAFRTLWEELVK